jgi:hypothetical protein
MQPFTSMMALPLVTKSVQNCCSTTRVGSSLRATNRIDVTGLRYRIVPARATSWYLSKGNSNSSTAFHTVSLVLFFLSDEKEEEGSDGDDDNDDDDNDDDEIFVEEDDIVEEAVCCSNHCRAR